MRHIELLRAWFVGTLSAATLAVAVLSCWLIIWPVWRDHLAAQELVRQVEATPDHGGHDISLPLACQEALEKVRDRESAAACLAMLIYRAEFHVRWRAIVLLGQIGPDAKAAVPALTWAMEDENPLVRGQAALAIWRISGRADLAVPTLVDLVEHQTYNGRMAAMQLLAEIGPDAQQAVPALRDVLVTDEDRHVRAVAADTLRRIEP